MPVPHTGGMFDKKVQAEALILDDEGPGHVVDTGIHGVDWDHRTYIVEVRPPGQEPFRIVQRLLALNTAIRHNWQIGAPVKRSLIACDH
jgi:hypothetical protein